MTREAEAARIKAQADADRLTSEKNIQAAAALAEAERVKRDTTPEQRLRSPMQTGCG